MKKMILMLTLIVLPVFSFGQLINGFNVGDEGPDTTYWDYETSASADSTLSYVTASYLTDPVSEGATSLQLEYSAHNIEGWGGYAKIFHMHPEVATGGTYDWSGYDSISFDYYVSVPQSGTQNVELRLNLSDYAGIEDDAYTDLGEYYYSFHNILSSAEGWNTLSIPLIRNDSFDGSGFNLTGWAGSSDDGQLDVYAIAGFHFEFSVGGSGEGDHTSGVIIIDNFTLTGYQGTDLIMFNGLSTPPAWGDPFSWGGAQMYVTELGGYDEGTNALTYIQEDVWSGGGFNMTPAVDLASGGEWLSDSLSFHMWSEADAPTLRLQFEDGTDKAGFNFTPESAGGWNHYKFALADFSYWDGSTAFDTSAITVFQVLSEGNGASGRTFHFDNMWTGTPTFDIIAPNAPENISAVPANYYNLVTWADVGGESDELYHVYASNDPITDVHADGVDLVAENVLEGSQAAVHYLYAPLNDASVSNYYAVVCVDASGNQSELGVAASSITNTAQGMPTISLDVPSNFSADGDMSEWLNSGIMPFTVNTETGYVVTGEMSGGVDDLNATVYLAVDSDYLYFAADVVDDSYFFGEGDWWMQDALQLFIGLYDWRGPKHASFQRGEEPDYILYMNETTLSLDIGGGGALAAPGDGNYFFEGYNPDYAMEGKISLDSLSVNLEDSRFEPVNGMRIPIEVYFHDNDNGNQEGRIGISPYNNDNAYQTPQAWTYTWIGNASVVSGLDEGSDILADEFTLYPNYPNPFNPVTNINFSLTNDQFVNLSIYNMKGQLVANLVNERKVSGNHSVHWNASGVASGVYLYQLQADGKSITHKMVLMK
tara:strand:+ start:1254 stop:3725 length:2472 start_codon:yes stop_codon:yes gene_type:complete